MKNGKWIVGLVIAAAAVTPVESAEAAGSGNGNFLTYYPATMCNAFGNTSVGPNGGSEIVNWSSTNTALVDCPLPNNAFYLDNYVYLTKRGSMSCVMLAQQRNGTGWAWHPAGENFNGGLDELFWNSENESYAGVSVECVLQPMATLNSYRVSEFNYWTSDP